MGEVEQIVTVDSSVPCFVNGYPTIAFGGANAQIIDGGALGNYPPAAPVALAPDVAASFMFQMSLQMSMSGGGCEPASAMYVGLPTGSAQTTIMPPSRGFTGWAVCGGGIVVTPFEQGNSIDNYAA